VTPLAPNSGLISWVIHSDTLHHLIREYRNSRNIVIDKEHREMVAICSDYDKLPLLHKVEVFIEAMSKHPSDDLARVLWLRSTDSEMWMLQRTNYTISLAVMSMVGYILGLGDRHPSNLMLDRNTGKVIHIDFGDCFEVAMKREKYPEKIPFRLTPMLIQAMEVSGTNGTYRITCENVMSVLRENSESLTAVLESFVYDPLVNWRLLTNVSPINTTSQNRVRRQSNSILIRDNYSDSFSSRPSSLSITTEPTDSELVNQRALLVLKRIKLKLCGRDFSPQIVLDVKSQVDNLIIQATAVENLCQSYIGWCPFW
jgi:FKBP12-rapamycin complex-associated protein